MADEPELPIAPAPSAPAEGIKDQVTTPPEGEQPEGEAAETKAPQEQELDLGELDEDEDDEQDDEADGEDEGEKRPSRAERYRRQAERLRAENEQLRNRGSGSLPPDQAALARAFDAAILERVGPPPQPEDFKDDYVGFSHARQAWETDRRITAREVRRDFIASIQAQQAAVADLVLEHKERVKRFKTKVKDFDEVMARSSVPVMPHVERLLLQSKKSERLSYVLGRNESKLVQLNRMSPEEAAREIGRLEGRLSLPSSAKTQTKARKPITPLKGTGTAAPSGLAAVNNYMKKIYGDRMK